VISDFGRSSYPAGPPGASSSSAATSARRWPKRTFSCAGLVLAALVAFGLRAFHLDVSWEISEDEIDYLQIAHGVLRTLWVVGWDGGPFYLHPPLFFFLEAAYIKLFGIDGVMIQQIYGVRYLNAALGGLSAGALLWLGRRLAGWPAGIATAAIFILDPFAIRMHSRIFLDAPAVLWVLLGYGVLFSALVREDRRLVSWWRTVATGVLFGLALLTKEKSAFVTLLPLGICFVAGWALPRTRSALAGVVALMVYTPYLAIVYAIGDWTTFLDQKSAGVSRMAGLLQVTGFNQRGGPSFVDAIVYRLNEFGTTYMLLATGAVAVCVLLLTDLGKAPANRLLVSWTSSAYAFLAYAMIFGTLEEHFFYYLVVPSILATTVTTALVLRKMRVEDAGRHPMGAAWRTHNGRRGRLVQEALLDLREIRFNLFYSAAAVFAVALTVWSTYVWVMVHIVPDNGYERVVSYVVDELPEGSRVAVTSTMAEPLIQEHVGGGAYESAEALQADNVEYVVISSYLSTRGWGQPPPEVYRWVRNHGELVYGFEGRSSGLLGVWRLQDHAQGATPAPEEVSDQPEQETTKDQSEDEKAVEDTPPSKEEGVSNNLPPPSPLPAQPSRPRVEGVPQDFLPPDDYWYYDDPNYWYYEPEPDYWYYWYEPNYWELAWLLIALGRVEVSGRHANTPERMVSEESV
jgi:4-amino-4-deoxy-L-arabinose transferase-like glycosyltransferase